jgi:3-hydroxyisobutyrate dehydrogenase-like beta-hydroxyacid dehydrogenase
MRTAVLGLGEAGRRYAADLAAAGWQVTGYDPAPLATPAGVRRAASLAEAVGQAELVLGLTGARFAVPVAEQAAADLPGQACYADFNSAAPAAKREVARALAGTGAEVADVAVLAPVPRLGAATPLLVSGPGADRVAAAFREVGAEVDVLAEPVGAAAGRKLLRSVFMKGLAAVVLEAVSAGAAAGCEDWVRAQMAAELGEHGPALVERLITGTKTHAARRLHEVEASRDYLAELGVRTSVCEATLAWLGELAGSQVQE